MGKTPYWVKPRTVKNIAVRVLHQNGSLYSKNSILGKTPYVKKLVYYFTMKNDSLYIKNTP